MAKQTKRLAARPRSVGRGHGVAVEIDVAVGLRPMLLKKSFCTRDKNSFWLYTRLSCKDVGDLIA
jgi:hypothetical protein